MAKHKVEIRYRISQVFDVEANNVDEAVQLAVAHDKAICGLDFSHTFFDLDVQILDKE